jgi:hypothetical protein
MPPKERTIADARSQGGGWVDLGDGGHFGIERAIGQRVRGGAAAAAPPSRRQGGVYLRGNWPSAEARLPDG